jgi:hypothetical protein
MTRKKESAPITVIDVIRWNSGKGSKDLRRRIESDLERPDSVVKEYLAWEGGDRKVTHSRLVEEHLQSMYAAAGGQAKFVETFLAILDGEEPIPDGPDAKAGKRGRRR